MESHIKNGQDYPDIYYTTARPKEQATPFSHTPIKLKAPERIAIPRGSLEESERLIGEKLKRRKDRRRCYGLCSTGGVICIVLILLALLTVAFGALNFFVKRPKPDPNNELHPKTIDIPNQAHNTAQYRHPSLFYDFLKDSKDSSSTQ
ncbi:hypothetical protein BC829DRAFT_418951 [Chytridium lagenaria]|nr:hypothetical protein BC829DRAFT_418951 [Chytridium lagenaria]